MQRVLIADDNSNVQKMVALAFKDAGIEVIAVGNGEAAVRKMAEVNPDLVLADIFMPVRSGYEVCEFVKHDPRYMRTPVVLLVGAFDPLDEREAQRVQADGVLKKPFVPPEPLVNMVMGLLARSAGEKAAVASATSASAAAPAAPAVKESKPAPAVKPKEIPDAAEEFISSSAAVTFTEKEKRPLAFSSLLETAAQVSSDETDPIVTATRDPSLGEPAFWAEPAAGQEGAADELTEKQAWEPGPHRSNTAPMLGPEIPEPVAAEESEEIEEVTVEFSSALDSAEVPREVEAKPAALVDTTQWMEARPDRKASEPEPEAVPAPEPALELPSSLSKSESEWRRWAAETTAAPEIAVAPQAEPDTTPAAEAAQEAIAHEAPEEKQDAALPVHGAFATSKVGPGAETVIDTFAETFAENLDEAFPKPAGLPVESVSETAARVEPEPDFAPPAVHGFSEAPATHSEIEKPVIEEAPAPAPSVPAMAEVRSEEPAPTFAAPAVPEPVAETPVGAKTAEAIPVEMTAPKPAAAAGPEKKVELLSVHEDFPALDELWKSAEPAFPWADAEFPGAVARNAGNLASPAKSSDVQESASLSSSLAVAVAESSAAEISPSAAAEAKLRDAQFMEAVVERVLERMQPRMVEIVTQEILRPVVEAMVRREMEKS